MRLEAFAGRRVGLLGFGREGRAVEQAFRARGVDAAVTVLAEACPEVGPAEWPLEVGPFANLPARFDVLLRSPGVPLDQPALAGFRTAGKPVVAPGSVWFAERPEARVVAVTGSKGKSTTAALIAHLLGAAGLRAELAGNIGVPLLAHLDTPADWFVVELSSYQLADLEGRPEVGAITRLFAEHTDWHGGAEAYFRAKLRLLELLAGNRLVINAADRELKRATAGYANRLEANRSSGIHASAQGVARGESLLIEADRLKLPGRHNLENLAVALACLEALGLDVRALAPAAAGFCGLPHRLEKVPCSDGVDWVNDSIATSPHATRAALEAFAGRPVVLIAGGQERGADWSPVIEILEARPLAGLVCLPDNGRRVRRELEASGCVGPDRAADAGGLAEAVAEARRLAPSGAVVLLSPGAPSFPHFRDFEDRGNRFRALVKGMGRRARG